MCDFFSLFFGAKEPEENCDEQQLEVGRVFLQRHFKVNDIRIYRAHGRTPSYMDSIDWDQQGCFFFTFCFSSFFLSSSTSLSTLFGIFEDYYLSLRLTLWTLSSSLKANDDSSPVNWTHITLFKNQFWLVSWGFLPPFCSPNKICVSVATHRIRLRFTHVCSPCYCWNWEPVSPYRVSCRLRRYFSFWGTWIALRFYSKVT